MTESAVKVFKEVCYRHYGELYKTDGQDGKKVYTCMLRSINELKSFIRDVTKELDGNIEFDKNVKLEASVLDKGGDYLCITSVSLLNPRRDENGRLILDAEVDVFCSISGIDIDVPINESMSFRVMDGGVDVHVAADMRARISGYFTANTRFDAEAEKVADAVSSILSEFSTKYLEVKTETKMLPS